MAVNIAIIGCGRIAEKHLQAYRRLAGVNVAVADLESEKARSLAHRFELEWHVDPRELIQRSDIDGVDVCVPTHAHQEIITEALERQKHVFCEKPLTTTREEALRIKALWSQAGVNLMTGYLYRFHPAFRLIKEVLEQDIIGRPYFALFRLGGRGGSKEWKHRKSRGGGAINEMLVHMLDLALWYFGSPISVQSLLCETLLKEREIEGELVDIDAEDVTLVRAEMPHGVTVLCQSDLITPSYMNYIELQGTNGSAWGSILDYFPTIVYCKEPRGAYKRGNNFFRFPRVNLFESELRHFIETIKNGRTADADAVESSVELVNIMEELNQGLKVG
ncbi:MAG: Gfo/Idh/MocA family oxidoreductase [Dehalococcoidia bacterium]